MIIFKEIQTGEDIQAAWQTVLENTATYFENVPTDIFYIANGEKWSIAENVDHLIRSTKPVATSLKLPKIALKAFGKPNRSSRTFEELVQKYQGKLAEGGVAKGVYIPSQKDSQTELCKKWRSIGEKLSNRISKWSEEDLEKYLLPHPLLGKLTIREMLFFTVYHALHHYNTCKKYH